MKNNFIKILIILFPILITDCSVDNTEEKTSNKYLGTWVWLKTEGGIGPRIITPADGATLTVSFYPLSIFRLTHNDTLKVSANYNILVMSNDWDKISYKNITTYNYNFFQNEGYAEINTDTLIIWDGFIDGYFSFYKKIR